MGVRRGCRRLLRRLRRLALYDSHLHEGACLRLSSPLVLSPVPGASECIHACGAQPMHNFLKALWAAGALGALVVLASSPSHSLVVESFLHPELLLASGWVFVALTGLFFKEWACFQRWEASALFALVPVLTGGHFLHILPQGLEAGLAAALAVMFPFFALRKFEQPLKADIGDKSIFEYFKRVERGELTEADMEVARRMGMRD